MNILLGVLTFIGLYAAKLYSYPLFHSLVELFSVIIACGIFIIAWNTRRIADNHYFLFIGISYLFVGAIDLAHMLAYKGMGVFQGYTSNMATQLWIAARYLQSLSLLVAPLFIYRRLKVSVVFASYIFAVCIIFPAIFVYKSFPDCFIEGTGLTTFKIVSEYVICIILIMAIAVLYKSRVLLDNRVFGLLSASMIITILSEMSFTLYTDVYGIFNVLGHYLKVISFYLIYITIIEKGITQPFLTIFRDLKKKEELLQKSTDALRERVKELNCLYSVSEIVRRNDISREAALRECASLLAKAYQFPEIAACRITWDNHIYSTENFRQTAWSQSRAIMVHDKQAGSVEICYLEERREEYEGPFLAEERHLLDSIAELLGRSAERRQAEEDRERFVVELQKALSEVKTLSGLLPICANCKKIRDDKGFWNQVELYVSEHTSAEFSHGICPECAKKLYPELFGNDS